jgi:carbon starvation protein
MPALTKFVDGSGPVVPGTLFPFPFITIACGAVSGWHSLVSSGTTPKLLASEPDARMVGYGAMILESFVGIMALIAACVLTPGTFFAINAPAGLLGTTVESASTAVRNWGFTVNPADLTALAQRIGEHSVLSRTGGAPSLAIGMADIFSNVFGGGAMAIWYHFAIMFEALFILSTIDAGTRVGRFMLQDLLGHVYKPLGRVSWYPGLVATSLVFVGMWGWFLYQGVVDPLGGINTLWPLFGISNQLLAAVALCVGTTVFVKMGKARYSWVTIAPLAWLVIVTMTAGWEKLFAADPKMGFLAHAAWLRNLVDTNTLPANISAQNAPRMIFNDYVNVVVTGFFMLSVIVILADSIRVWLAYRPSRAPEPVDGGVALEAA